MSAATSERAFPGIPLQVREARQWTGRRLADAGLDEAVIETAVLLVSELATNAVRHTLSGIEGGRFRVRVVITSGAWARVEVRDEGPLPGRAVNGRGAAADPLAEGGRGLALVDELAPQWGGGDGMRWFRLPWQDTTAVPAPAASPEQAGALW